MDKIWLRTAEKLIYVDPVTYLIKMQRLEIVVNRSDLDAKVKALRMNDQKPYREHREAALFCIGISERLGYKVYFAAQEDQDYDFIAMWIIDDTRHFAQVQLKELVPAHINSLASIEDILISLKRLTDSRRLTVAIHLNRECRFEPDLLKVPDINIQSLWIFGSATADKTSWNLWGNFIDENPIRTQFFYPKAH